MVSEGAGDDTGKWVAGLRGVKTATPASLAAMPGEVDKLDFGLFSATLNFSQDRKISTEIATVLPPGPASMFVVGTTWTQSNYKFQLPIVAIRPGDVLVSPVKGAT
jgi:hypothetical protein